MIRKELIDFVNENVLTEKECNIDFYTWKYHGKELFFDIIHAIERYRIGKPAKMEMNVTVSHGILYINGDRIMKIGSYYPEKIDFSGSRRNDCGIDYESLILQRQENDGIYDI